jgi:hypothetical protein
MQLSEDPRIQLTENHWQQMSSLSVRTAAMAVLCDVEPAARLLRRPHLDYSFDGWLYQRLRPFFTCHPSLVVTELKSKPGTTHLSVHSRVVRDALETIRICASLCKQPISFRKRTEHGHEIYKYGMTATTFALGQLLTAYHDLKGDPWTLSSREKQHSPHAGTEALRHHELALILTTIYVLCKCTREVYIDNKDIYDTSHILFPLLRTHLERANAQASKEATFWMLSCGAHHERRVEQGLALQSDPPQNGWFRLQFLRKTRELQVRSWFEAQKILSQFVYLDRLQPTDHEAWFHEVTHGAYRRSGSTWTDSAAQMTLRCC